MAARHLKQYGCNNVVLYLARKVNDNLVNQFNMAKYSECEFRDFGDFQNHPETLEQSMLDFEKTLHDSDLILDALFGYSFKGPSRQPYTSIITSLIKF